MFNFIKAYNDFVGTLEGAVLCNDIAKFPLELVSGSLEDENGNYKEIFQYYIIADPWFAQHHTNEIIFYCEELDVHVLGVTHYGTS